MPFMTVFQNCLFSTNFLKSAASKQSRGWTSSYGLIECIWHNMEPLKQKKGTFLLDYVKNGSHELVAIFILLNVFCGATILQHKCTVEYCLHILSLWLRRLVVFNTFPFLRFLIFFPVVINLLDEPQEFSFFC